MMRIRTGNRRRRRALEGWHEPMKCPRHGLAYRGAGWASHNGRRVGVFECPAPHCTNCFLWDDPQSAAPAPSGVAA